MKPVIQEKTAILFAVAMMLAACGGSSSDEPANAAPVARAGANATVDEFASVTLDGSASSDADGDAMTFSWTQTAGTTVSLTNATSALATFDAPDVTALNTPDTLTFQLQVSDGTRTGTDTVTIAVIDIGLGLNSAPTASAGPDQTVAELVTVNLDGSGSADPDGDAISYAWLQTAGPSVTLSDPTVPAPSFTSPDVTTPVVLTFQLTVDDGADNSMDTVDITVQETLSQVVVAGIVSFEFVLPRPNCNGLNLDNPETRPIRGAPVQLFDSSNALLDSTVSGADGSYSFSDVDANLDVYVRVRAELQRTVAPTWDVQVRDNVDTSGSPPALPLRPLYAVDFPTFNTGAANIFDADFTATTGWNGSSYTGPRQAAPFAILDAIMDAMEMVTAVDPAANFPPLDAFWSVNNTLSSPTDIDAGELGSSFYRGDIDSLFLLGDANTDTEEFDDHVTVHEWGHYFEDNFSRSDSIGGAHTIGESLDPRLAFGEGFATALAAIALDNPQYCDTSAPLESSGFRLDTENENRGNQGYYNEMSVATLLYDLVDTDIDGTDVSSIGFEPIYNVMTGPQSTTDAFTSLFSFATEILNEVQVADRPFVESQLARENIDIAGLNEYGDSQTIAPAGSRDVLPVYTVLPTDGTLINICTNSDFDNGRDGNKLSEHRFLKFTTSSTASYNVTVVPNPVPPPTTDPAPTPPAVIRDRSDPDVFIYRGPTLVAIGTSPDDDSETFTTNPLPPGNYVMALQEWRYADDDASSDYPEQICFDVTMGP